MRYLLTRCSGPAVLLALLFGVSYAAPDSPGDNPVKETPAEKIKKQLDKTLPTLEITDQPLKLAIAQLKEQTKINFVADQMVIAQMGIDMESTPVTVKLKDVKLKTALRTIFGQYNLSYAIVGETVVITTDEMAMYRQMRQRVNVDYDQTKFASALKQLSRETATNLIIDSRAMKEAQNPISLQLEDVPLETAVRLMAETAGLKPVRVGNVLYVTSKANANELRADPDLAPVPTPRQPGAEEVIIGGGVMARPAIFGPVGVPTTPAVPPPAPGGAPPAPPGGADKGTEKPAEKEKPPEKEKEKP
jgi:hypothetical protein